MKTTNKNRYILCYKKGRSMCVKSDDYQMHHRGGKTADGKIVVEESGDYNNLKEKADKHNQGAPRIFLPGLSGVVFSEDALA